MGVLLVGDCARKYERMGELPGDGRPAEGEDGVGGTSEIELSEPDEPEESEAERSLALRVAELVMGIGSECFTLAGGVLLAAMFATNNEAGHGNQAKVYCKAGAIWGRKERVERNFKHLKPFIASPEWGNANLSHHITCSAIAFLVRN